MSRCHNDASSLVTSAVEVIYSAEAPKLQLYAVSPDSSKESMWIFFVDGDKMSWKLLFSTSRPFAGVLYRSKLRLLPCGRNLPGRQISPGLV